MCIELWFELDGEVVSKSDKHFRHIGLIIQNNARIEGDVNHKI